MPRLQRSIVVSGTVIVIVPRPMYAPRGTTTFQWPTLTTPPSVPLITFDVTSETVFTTGSSPSIGSRRTVKLDPADPGASLDPRGAVGSVEQPARAMSPATRV